MKKQDLKAGMLVELRSGEECILIPNKGGLCAMNVANYNTPNYGWTSQIGAYNNDLTTSQSNSVFDIMKVWSLSDVSPLAPKEKRKLLWERKPKIELTPCEKDILKLLGQIGYDVVFRQNIYGVYAYTLGSNTLFVETASFSQLGTDATRYSIKELLKGE